MCKKKRETADYKFLSLPKYIHEWFDKRWKNCLLELKCLNKEKRVIRS